ncbi:MAG: hypothetical protein JRH20_23915, partial [Deltaproteobacteria bacterium]|nr:hypothetical protein [Deltaproteobacteria bacterium]
MTTISPLPRALMMLLSIITWAGCGSDSNNPDAAPLEDATLEARSDVLVTQTRSFFLGFTPQVHDISQEAIDFVYQGIEDNSDMIVHHLDEGVPWPEMLAGSDFPPRVLADLEGRRGLTPKGHQILLTASPMSQDRKTIAGYWNEDARQPLPGTWQSKTLADQDVISAYTHYCLRLIEFFQPDYFAYAIEVNGGLKRGDPELAEFLTLAESVYGTLKERHPTLPIMITVQAVAFDKTHQEVLDVTGDLLVHSDTVALSTYPYWL